MVRLEKCGVENARSVTPRRDEGDKTLQSHSGLVSQSIATFTEIQLPLSVHLLLYSHFPSVHLTAESFVTTKPHPYVTNLFKRRQSQSILFPFVLLCPYSITGSLRSLTLGASISLVPFTCDEARQTAVLTKP